MREEHTRLIPIGRDEAEWAHNRPGPHRVPVPKVDDWVLYRHDEWGEVFPAQVLAVQPLDDLDDPHLAFVERDALGQLILIDGRPVIALKKDPWPKVRLRTTFRERGSSRLITAVVETREARLRGSPGWLPKDWETRHRPLPGGLVSGGWTP